MKCYVAIVAVCPLLLVGVSCTQPRPKQSANSVVGDGQSKPADLTPAEKEFLVNKKIFRKAQMSAQAPTFEGADLILKQIDDNEITDADLASYVALSKNIAQFCADIGIPRDADISYVDIFKKLDYTAILHHVTKKATENAGKTDSKLGAIIAAAGGIAETATKLTSDALKIKRQIPIYDDLDSKLSAKYGE